MDGGGSQRWDEARSNRHHDCRERHRANFNGSVGLTSNSKLPIICIVAYDAEESHGNAAGSPRQAAGNDKRNHVAATCTERQPNPNLARTLRRAVGHHTIDTNQRQPQRKCGEHGQHCHENRRSAMEADRTSSSV